MRSNSFFPSFVDIEISLMSFDVVLAIKFCLLTKSDIVSTGGNTYV